MEVEAAFRQAIEAAGLCPGEIIPDGKLHRCPVEGKPGAKDGAYRLYPDDPPAGWFMNWRTGQEGTWTSGNGHKLSEAERQEREASRQRREEQQRAAWAEAARVAQKELAQAKPCEAHPYLERKGVKPCPGLKVDQAGRLLVPVLGPDGKAQSLQSIAPGGDKLFHAGGRMAGGYFAVKGDAGPLVVCEGLATGLSLHEATGHTVLVAFNAGNLEAVARMARGKYPERAIIIAGDDDHATPGNPGHAKARAAALAVGGKLALPAFAQSGTGTDFNDLHQAEGLEAVARQVGEAFGPEPQESAPGETEPPDPVPFNSHQPAPLPVDVLPAWAAGFITHAAEHHQVAPDMVLANVLGAVATACARKLRVEVRPGYREPVNLYLLCPALPGERKSATQALAVGPLLDWEREQAQAMAGEIREAASRRKSEEAVINWLRSKLGKASPEDRPGLMQEIASLELALTEVPRAPRLLADDLTPEAAAAIMAEQGERLGIISAEGGLFDTLAGRYSSGVPNLDLFLKAHSGDPVRVDRRHAPPVVMQSPALTLCLSPQPEVMAGLADKPGFRGRGLIARFAFVLPASRMGHRQVSPPPVPGHVLEGYRRAIISLLDLSWAVDEQGEPAAHVLKLSLEARRDWEDFSAAIESALKEGGELEAMRDWGGKLPGLAARLAGLIHAMEHLEAAPGRPVSQPTMERALNLAGALVGHALAAFQQMGADPDLEAAKHALAWIRREHVERFTARDCHRGLRGRYPRAAQVQAALAVLEERAFIFPQEAAKPGPGRPTSPGYTTNPKALGV